MNTKRLFSVLLIYSLLPMAAIAGRYQDPATKVNYSYDPTTKKASLAVGYIEYFNNETIAHAGSPEASGNVTILSHFTIDGITYTVTDIGNHALSNCRLTSVTIPSTVKMIGDNAFLGCSTLKNVNISDIGAWCNISFLNPTSNPLSYAKHMYLNGVELTNLVIPDNITQINQYAFKNCLSLKTVTIPASVNAIGQSAFYDCDCLESVTIEGSETSIYNSAFYNCDCLKNVFFKETTTTADAVETFIASGAFADCISLSSVTFSRRR